MDQRIGTRTPKRLRRNGAAVVAGDLAQALAVLEQGIDSPPHAAFVGELSSKRDER